MGNDVSINTCLSSQVVLSLQWQWMSVVLTFQSVPTMSHRHDSNIGLRSLKKQLCLGHKVFWDYPKKGIQCLHNCVCLMRTVADRRCATSRQSSGNPSDKDTEGQWEPEGRDICCKTDRGFSMWLGSGSPEASTIWLPEQTSHSDNAIWWATVDGQSLTRLHLHVKNFRQPLVAETGRGGFFLEQTSDTWFSPKWSGLDLGTYEQH